MKARAVRRFCLLLLAAFLLAAGAQAQQWRVSATSQNLNKVWMLNSTTGWAVGNGGIICRTTDGGAI